LIGKNIEIVFQFKTQTCKQDASTFGQIERISKVTASWCTYLIVIPESLATIPSKDKQTKKAYTKSYCFWDIGPANDTDKQTT
jgi:hypothetical protein